MILWTIHPLKVYELIQRTGVYRCDPAQCDMLDFSKEQYDWLACQMSKRLDPPECVKYPVWAWYKQEWKRCKPDLRRERWANGRGGENYVCMEIDIPDNRVLLSDFDNWHLPLNNGFLSSSEEECDALEKYYNSLDEAAKKAYKYKNWEQVFNITPFENDWERRGSWVQATFWELQKSQITAVRFFKTERPARCLNAIFMMLTAM